MQKGAGLGLWGGEEEEEGVGRAFQRAIRPWERETAPEAKIAHTSQARATMK